VVLYEMLARRLPFRANTAADTAVAILHDNPPDLTDEEATPELRAVVGRCLEKDPQRRYQSAEELLIDVRSLALGNPQSFVQPNSAPKGHPNWKKMARWCGFAVLLAGVVAVGYRWHSKRPAVPVITSLAVLPLANLSSDPEQEYFSDGMTDAIINELSRANTLKVISRTSVMRYKGTKKSVREIGRELGVDAIVEGTVIRSGDRVRITAQLIQTATDMHLWAETYERDASEVLRLQGEVATDIASRISSVVKPLDQPRRVNPDAYGLYLKGRDFFYRYSDHGWQQAIEHFNRAIEVDPEFAPAYSGLADAYLVGEKKN